MKYDIATKVLLERCRDELIRHFLGIDVRESVMIEEFPQETVSLKRSDFPVLVTDRAGKELLAVLEIQSSWNRRVPLHLLDCRTRYLIRREIKILSCVILLVPSGSATDRYQDDEVGFRFRLVRVYEMDAREIMESGLVCLFPFVPLMKGGRQYVDEADQRIYASGKGRREKADMLTSMAILSGLVSKDLPAMLIARRRDIMIESAAYDIIKEEGIREGKTTGIRESLTILIESKFGEESAQILKRLDSISDTDRLLAMFRVIHLSQDAA
ncbi:MAG: hypothetical protein ACLFTV_13785, partial [Desulfococcaceae bacterium]